MIRRSLVLSLLLSLVLAVSVPSSVLATASDDPVAIVDAQFAAVPTVTTACSPAAVVQWLDSITEIFRRIATGGLPAMPPSAVTVVQTLGTQVLTSNKFTADAQIVDKIIQLLPSLWATGFFYAKATTWKPLFTAVTLPLTAVCKPRPVAYESLVNATSRLVRFTKDTMFFDGIDHGNALANAEDTAYMSFLAQILTKVSKTPGFSVNATQLRAFMNVLPSKRDGMDMTKPYPVYVNTTKYADTDAALLRRFLTIKPTKAETPIQQSV